MDGAMRHIQSRASTFPGTLNMV